MEKENENESNGDSQEKKEAEKKPDNPGREAASFPVVGLGASAGGLKSLEMFVSNLPENSGIAFVVISHSDPERTSLLPDILQRKSVAPVKSIEDGAVPEPGVIFTPPSDRDVILEKGLFRLKGRDLKDGLHMPVDRFLESLAAGRGELAGCAVLSGTGTDGSYGVRFIKETGGVSIAETPESAGYSGMPRSAIDTGLIDYILEPARMPGALIDYFQNRSVIEDIPEADGQAGEPDGKQIPEWLKKILRLLAARTGHDFSAYKKSTLIRRIERRMTVTRTQTAGEYFTYLQNTPEESQALFRDLLIGVTEFFRDSETFEFLKTKVLPDIYSRISGDEPLRAWVAGCATGEEAYSLAIVIHEYMKENDIKRDMQLFATDIDPRAIEKAREAVYLPNIAARVGARRLENFFTPEGDRYKVSAQIREPLVFAEQDVLQDPPFTRLDLLFCRNLLIYLDSGAQNRLIPLFHYSLKPEGSLFLGASETIGRFSRFFKSFPKTSIYKKVKAPHGIKPEVAFPTSPRKSEPHSPVNPSVSFPYDPQAPSGVAQAVEQLLLRKYTPVCVVVDQNGLILHIHGRTGKYLELPPGKPNLEAASLAREGLRFPLTSALRDAASSRAEVRRRNIQVKTNSRFEEIDLTVTPLNEPANLKGAFLILFEKSPAAQEKKKRLKPDEEAEDDPVQRNIELEQELGKVREDYRSALEELETSNEELKSVNEEIHSSNEELQSANEELESSREELQSLNEELNTVNHQLQVKNEELCEAYASITDVLNSTKIAILFLDTDLSVKRYTPEAAICMNTGGGFMTAKAFGGGEEIMFRCKNGDFFWGIVEKGELLDDEEAPCGFVFSVIDITRRKQIESDYQKSEKKRNRLFELLTGAQEKERNRIARELHDGACSSLTAVKFALEQKVKLEQSSVLKYDPEKDVSLETVIEMVQNTLDEIRRMSHALNSSVIESRGVSGALHDLCEECRMINPDIDIELLLNLEDENIPDHLGVLIYRIVQEAVNNAFKYSEADCVIISLTNHNRVVELSVQDNGKGFDPFARIEGNSLGLANMKERTRLSGGEYEIEAAPGEGAAIKTSWDLKRMIPEN